MNTRGRHWDHNKQLTFLLLSALCQRGSLKARWWENYHRTLSWAWLDWILMTDCKQYCICIVLVIRLFAETRPGHFGFFLVHILHFSLFCWCPCFVLVQPWSSAAMLLQGIPAWYCWSCVLLIILPCCIMLSMVLVTLCGQYHSPVPCGVVGLLSVPQRSSLWCDQHVVSWPVSDIWPVGVFFFFSSSYHCISLHPNAV